MASFVSSFKFMENNCLATIGAFVMFRECFPAVRLAVSTFCIHRFTLYNKDLCLMSFALEFINGGGIPDPSYNTMICLLLFR